jgi:copper chaperone CopZ
MKLILDDIVNEELKKYLLMQDGIDDVVFDNENFLAKLNIEYNKKTTPEIIMKYIELFQKNKYSILFEFDKGTMGDFRLLKYTIDDMCCEYCYKGLIMDLFENEKIKSVKSNFDFNKPAFDIEFLIEYNEDYSEQELIQYIKEKYN